MMRMSKADVDLYELIERNAAGLLESRANGVKDVEPAGQKYPNAAKDDGLPRDRSRVPQVQRDPDPDCHHRVVQMKESRQSEIKRPQ